MGNGPPATGLEEMVVRGSTALAAEMDVVNGGQWGSVLDLEVFVGTGDVAADLEVGWDGTWDLAADL